MNQFASRLLLAIAFSFIFSISASSQQVPAQRSMIVIPDFSLAVEQELQSVVFIRVTKVEEVPIHKMIPAPPGSAPGTPPKDLPIPPGASPDKPDEEKGGSGSGFIIKSDGYIVTNAHVVVNAKDMVVRLTNKRQYKAKLIGIDIKSDVAIIKIEATNLPVVRIGNPNDSKVGQWVIAIGAPFGFTNTVSAGIISAKDRPLPNNSFVRYIQTDAAVNPGNSGGPLFNLNGEVIGINSEIYSQTGSFAGIAFAIPIDTAMDVVNQLQAHGKIVRGRIGLQIQGLTDESAKALGLPDSAGALVADVPADGPAAKAGVKVGDVILAFGDKKVEESADLPMIVGATKPGTETTISVWRTGATLVLKIVVGELK
jgi:serine protease Do